MENKGRGQPKNDRKKMTVRVNPDTSARLNAMAKSFGYVYGSRGETGKLLDAIADLPTESQIVLKKLLEMSGE